MLNAEHELRIALPSKGRLKDASVNLLQKSGLRFRLSGRQLFARCAATDAFVIFSHAQDIPALVEEGVVDLGITGSDLVREKQARVTTRLPLGFGKCRLSFATHRDSRCTRVTDLGGRILGTKFVNLARAYLEEQGVPDVHILEISGAVEVMVLLGLVDAILDVVETGSSLREHDLVERDTILQAEAVLISTAKPRNQGLVDRLVRRMEGVVTAARYSLLEYNCPRECIEQAKAVTPGYSAPTVQETASERWLAVKVMVEKGKVQPVMDDLEALGCQAIIETEALHCRL